MSGGPDNCEPAITGNTEINPAQLGPRSIEFVRKLPKAAAVRTAGGNISPSGSARIIPGDGASLSRGPTHPIAN